MPTDRDSCDVCFGRGTITLPIRRPVVAAFGDSAPTLSPRAETRTYPCPECGGWVDVTPEMIEAGLDELFSHDIQLNSHFGGPSPETWRKAFAEALKSALAARSRFLSKSSSI